MGRPVKKSRYEDEVEALIIAYKSPDATPRQKREIEADMFERFSIVAKKIAHGVKDNALGFEERVDAQIMAIPTAIQKYDPAHEGNAKFLGFAAMAMKNELLSAVRDAKRITSNSLRILYAKEHIYRAEILEKNPDLEEGDIRSLIAKKLFRDPSSQIKTIEGAKAGLETYYAQRTVSFTSLNKPVNSHDDGKREWQDLIEDEHAPSALDIYAEKVDGRLLRIALRNAAEHLDTREKEALIGRLPFADGENSDVSLKTLAELSVDFGTSGERVRQIYERARQKLVFKLREEFRTMGVTSLFGENIASLSASAKNKPKRPYAKTAVAASENAPLMDLDIS